MQTKLERLTRLVGTDPGFYVLALHAFVEHYIRDIACASAAERFPDVVWEYRSHLIEQAGGGFVEGLNCLTAFARQHKFTNAVRHAFGELDSEEAVAATHLFVAFCTMVGIHTLPPVRTLEHTLSVWNQRTSVAEQSRVLHGIQEQLSRLKDRNTEILSQLQEYESRQAELATLESRIEQYSFELQQVHRRVKAKDQKVDRLRHERAELRGERNRLLRMMTQYQELERYIQNLGRVSVYTRTRLDYEHTLMRLTPEQEEAVAAIEDKTDILVRGSAGTGKSLILIEGLKRTLQVGQFGFAEKERERAVLLTFTRTLAKYEDYVSQILGMDSVRSLVRTVDTFILERLQRIDPAYHFDFNAVGDAVTELNSTDFFSNAELTAEIENYLFGNFVTREEYLGQMIARTGMRRRLAKSQREVVWDIREQIVARMRERGAFSRNFARLVILEHLAQADAGTAAQPADVRTIFLDETQDLTAGDLKTLKTLISGGLVMAADTAQTIYGVASPFSRAGIQIAGRTRLLRTNFRNTRQVQEVADRFAARGAEAQPLFAFREGPPPELYTAASPVALTSILIRKLNLFLGSLEYEPETVCILAPHNDALLHVSDVLEESGIPASVITDKEFSFASRGQVRISTLHSSKGLDFPVVLIYLPYLRRREQYDQETTERLLRNLIYVGLTRAMENLNVFVCPGQDPILNDLCTALG